MKTTLITWPYKTNTAPTVASATTGALLLSGKKVVSIDKRIENDAKTR